MSKMLCPYCGNILNDYDGQDYITKMCRFLFPNTIEVVAENRTEKIFKVNPNCPTCKQIDRLLHEYDRYPMPLALARDIIRLPFAIGLIMLCWPMEFIVVFGYLTGFMIQLLDSIMDKIDNKAIFFKNRYMSSRICEKCGSESESVKNVIIGKTQKLYCDKCLEQVSKDYEALAQEWVTKEK